MLIMLNRRLNLIGIIILALILASCAKSTPPVNSPEPGAVALEDNGVLNIYNWDTYIDPAILSEFEKKYSVTINYTTYGSNEEMLETLTANLEGGKAYDIVVPTDYMVSIMRKEGLLTPVDKSNIPNLSNLEAGFLNTAFDPGNRYCVPYLWGTEGLGYNIKLIGKDIFTWKEIFDPAFAGKVSLINDPRSSFGIILLSMGYSPNTTNVHELAVARDFLISQSDQIAVYADDTGQDLLSAGEVVLAYEYSGDIFQLMTENPDIRYTIPQEGAIIWMDNMCIPINSRHKTLTETFINYILTPEVSAALANYTRYSTPNHTSIPLINQADRDNPALYPPPEVRRRLFFIADVGAEATRVYDQYWTEVITKHSQ